MWCVFSSGEEQVKNIILPLVAAENILNGFIAWWPAS